MHGRANQGIENAITAISKAAASPDMNVQSVFFPSQEKTSYAWGMIKMDKAPIMSRQKEPHDFTLMFDMLNEKEALVHANDQSVNRAPDHPDPAPERAKLGPGGAVVGLAVQVGSASSPPGQVSVDGLIEVDSVPPQGPPDPTARFVTRDL